MRGSGGSGSGGGGGGGGGGAAGGGAGGGGAAVRTSPTVKIITVTAAPQSVTIFTYDQTQFIVGTLKYDSKTGIISPDMVVFTIGSVTENLLLGKQTAFDITKDGRPDVLVTLLKTGHNAISLEVVLASAVPAPAVAAQLPSVSPSVPTSGVVAASAPEASPPTGDFVQVDRQTTAVGGFTFSNKIISGALLLIVGFVIVRFWRRENKPKN